MTTYQWDSATSAPYDFSLGTPQGDCLSPILSALFLSVAIKHVFPPSLTPRPTRCLFFVFFFFFFFLNEKDAFAIYYKHTRYSNRNASRCDALAGVVDDYLIRYTLGTNENR